MRNSLTVFLLFISLSCWAQNNELFIDKFTNINPVSYTDVIFTGVKDTVLVSTYSGRISRIINNTKAEIVLAQINDEIYSLAYNKIKKEIIASTLQNGIVIINEKNGKILKKIQLNNSWANSIILSENYKFLTATDQKGKKYIFDVLNNYAKINDSLIPIGRITNINKENIATIVSSKKVIKWSMTEKKVINEWNVELVSFKDMDNNGNFLSIDFNECSKYNSNDKKVVFKIKHPNWPLPNPENTNEIFEIPLEMKLNEAKFAKEFIYTGGIDRSIRVWNKDSGKLIATLAGHKGSISKIKVTTDETQVVSIDLKGVIKFWNVTR